ncbi:MAG: (deoxy)nucleoside triphosphate pyrophosphohydrolase [Paludibacteraceae bacterium]|nr:(deoxy)nucleoside triphosphate pyrophosphohydrolase [Paludibacteraceae bacterium]
MKTIEVVAAIIKKDNKYLATQRGYGKYKDGWEFPGGKMEPGESREEAIVREIKEELATDIKVDSYLTTVDYDYEDFHLTMHCFLCSILDGNIELLEHEDAKWLGKEELHNVDWLPADLAIVDLL